MSVLWFEKLLKIPVLLVVYFQPQHWVWVPGVLVNRHHQRVCSGLSVLNYSLKFSRLVSLFCSLNTLKSSHFFAEKTKINSTRRPSPHRSCSDVEPRDHEQPRALMWKRFANFAGKKKTLAWCEMVLVFIALSGTNGIFAGTKKVFPLQPWF